MLTSGKVPFEKTINRQVYGDGGMRLLREKEGGRRYLSAGTIAYDDELSSDLSGHCWWLWSKSSSLLAASL